MELTLREIAELTGGRLAGDGARCIRGVASLERAGPNDLTFVANEKTLARLAGCEAGAVVAPEGLDVGGRDAIVHAEPHAAVAAVLARLHPEATPAPGVSEFAVVHASAAIGDGASIGPFAVVDERAEIGTNAVVGAGAYVGAGSSIGEGAVLRPRVVLYARVRIGARSIVHSGAVIGADGFGYASSGDGHTKIPQVGGVEIGDDVEIGANACIDGGTLDPTTVGDGSKIDDQVMVGHNCRIGRHVLLCGQVALAGSTEIGDFSVFGGRAGSAGHARVGKGATVAGVGVITGDIADGAIVAGYPHMPLDAWRRMVASARHLPEMRKDLRRLRKMVEGGSGEPRDTSN